MKKKNSQDTESAASATPKNRKKLTKGKIALIVIGALALIAVIYILVFGNRETPIPITTGTVARDDIEVILSYSGTISSSNVKSYYADITAPVSDMKLHVGDRVTAGERMISYDSGELALLKEKADLTTAQAEGNYSSSIEKNAKVAVKLTGMSLTEINNRVDEINAQTSALNAKIEEKTARMQRTLTDLQKTTMDVDQNNISDSTDAAEGNTAPVERMTEVTDKEKEKEKQMSLALQEAISEVQYALQYDPEILAWKKEINDLAEEKNKLTDAASAESSRLTSGEKEALEAQKSLTELDTRSTLEDVEAAEKGISAEFNGVVTELNVQEGETVSKGSKLITVTSTEDAQIDMQISKADIGRIAEGQLTDITIGKNTYTGKVAHISGTAVKNANGVPVVAAIISIDDPDDSIILGTEASLKIHTDKAEGVPVLPYEYIGADTDGDYVFLIDSDSRVVRRNVTVGLSTGTMAEITEGLNVGDKVITEDPETLLEGQLVVDMGPAE